MMTIYFLHFCFNDSLQGNFTNKTRHLSNRDRLKAVQVIRFPVT